MLEVYELHWYVIDDATRTSFPENKQLNVKSQQLKMTLMVRWVMCSAKRCRGEGKGKLDARSP